VPEAEMRRATTVRTAIWFSATDFPPMFAYRKLSRAFYAESPCPE
jgi:hypothetical protein